MAKDESTTTARLGTQRRDKILPGNSRRASRYTTFWVTYSPKTNRDWKFEGYANWAGFLLLEADPTIKDVEYSPPPIRVDQADGKPLLIRLNAIARYVNGAAVWFAFDSYPDQLEPRRHTAARQRYDEIAQSEARASGAIFRRTGMFEFLQQETLLRNWSHVIAWLAAIRDVDLTESMNDVATAAHASASITLGDVIRNAHDSQENALRIGAAFRLLQKGVLTSDLHLHPLSTRTLLYPTAPYAGEFDDAR